MYSLTAAGRKGLRYLSFTHFSLAIAVTAGSGRDAVKQAVVTGLLDELILTDEFEPKSGRVDEDDDSEGRVTEPMAFCDLCSVFASFPTCDPCPSGYAFWGKHNTCIVHTSLNISLGCGSIKRDPSLPAVTGLYMEVMGTAESDNSL